MRIQRYIARDMRNALAQVREALGPDAVILSSGRVGENVEVVAAIVAEVPRAVETAPNAPNAPRGAVRSEPLAVAAAPAPAATEPRHAELLKNRRASSQLSE